MKKQFLILFAFISVLALSQVPQRFNKVVVTGDITSPKFIKTGSNADSVLLGNGSARAISTIKTDTVNLSNRINAKATGTGTANGTNTGDETLTSIKTKLGAATSVSDGYLKYQDWNTFNAKEPAFSKNSGFNLPLGTTPGTVLEGRTFGTAANSAVGDFHPMENQRLSTVNSPTFKKVSKSTGTDVNYVFDGDSRTAIGTYSQKSYSEYLSEASNFQGTGNFYNFGVGGDAVQGIVDRYAGSVYPLKPNGTTIKEAYLFILIGINDLTVSDPDPVAIATAVINYCNQAKTDGFKVILMTTFYRNDFTQKQESARLVYNDLLRYNSENIYMLIDTEALFPPSTSNIFYYDVVHLRASGNYQLASYINSKFSVSNTGGNSLNRVTAQNVFTPKDGYVKINGTSNIPLKVESSQSESYISLKSSGSDSNYGSLLKNTGNDFGVYSGNGVTNRFYLNGTNGDAAIGNLKIQSPDNHIFLGNKTDGNIYFTNSIGVLGLFQYNGAFIGYGSGSFSGIVTASSFSGSGSSLTGVQLPITLTTNGTSGAATFSGNVLNVPNYTSTGTGGEFTSTFTNISNTTLSTSTLAAYTNINGIINASVFGAVTSTASGKCTFRVSVPATIRSGRCAVVSGVESGKTTSANIFIEGTGSTYVDISFIASTASSILEFKVITMGY